MPTIIMCAPTSRALSSAALSEPRTCSSSASKTVPSSSRGGMLISTLNCPSSVTNASSAIRSSTSALAIAGSPASSVRLSSISSPIERFSASNRASRSIRANTSRFRLTLSRYRWRSSRENCVAATSSPMPRSVPASRRAPAARARAARAARARSRRGSCGARSGSASIASTVAGSKSPRSRAAREVSASRDELEHRPFEDGQRGHGEVALRPVDHRVGHDAARGALEHALAAVGELELGRDPRRELDQVVVEERRPRLQPVRHRHRVDALDRVLDEHQLGVDPQRPVDRRRRRPARGTTRPPRRASGRRPRGAPAPRAPPTPASSRSKNASA